MDYCTAGPQYASGGFIADTQHRLHHQRLAAAVPRAGQQRSAAGPTRSGTRSSPASRARRPQSFPEPAVHHAADQPGDARRSPTCTSTRSATTACSCPRRARTRRARPGPTARPPAPSIPLRRFYVATPADARATINEALAAGPEPDLHARRVPRRPDDQRCSTPDTIVSAWASRRSSPTTASSRCRWPTSTGVKIAGLIFDAGPVNSPVAAAGRRPACPPPDSVPRPDGAPGRLLPHRRGRASARRPPAWWSTATT